MKVSVVIVTDVELLNALIEMEILRPASGHYDQAAPLLLKGYEGPSNKPNALDIRKTQALQRIVDLYDAWNEQNEAAEWRAKLPDEVNSNEQDD